MTVEEVQSKINETKEKITQLKNTPMYAEDNNFDTTIAEIKQLQKQLDLLNTDLEQIKEHDAYIEEQRKSAFKKVKNEYKKNSIWARFIYKVGGKSPDWKKVSNYSLEQLDHLLRVREGDTKFQHDSDKMKFRSNIDAEKNRKKYLSPTALDKAIDESHKSAFNDQLSSDESLNESMELEASNGRW